MNRPLFQTERLNLRELTSADAPFLLELLNEPGILQNIGDRGVRSLEDARRYVMDGPALSYAQHGFGLWRVGLKPTDEAVGICGLIQREYLDDPDVGYAFLQRVWGQGLAEEAARACLKYGYEVLGLKRIVAITAMENPGSIRVLEKIGLRFDKVIRPPGGDGESRYFTPAET